MGFTATLKMCFLPVFLHMCLLFQFGSIILNQFLIKPKSRIPWKFSVSICKLSVGSMLEMAKGAQLFLVIESVQ